MKRFRTVLAMLQFIFAARAFYQMARTATGARIAAATNPERGNERVTALVPVLNEESRLDPCLAGLAAQGEVLSRIRVIDGGSTDRTRDVVRRWAERDARVSLVDAAPVPPGVNGKAHNLQKGLDAAPQGADWILTIDADVRPEPGLVDALLAHAATEGVNALSVATRQELSGAAEALVHPSMLATLVYRYGIPGTATTNPHLIQANGQCSLTRATILREVGGFSGVLNDVSEDVTLARLIAMRGHPVGFYESDDLVRVEMYAGWRDAWDNWTRSLPMRDRFTTTSSALGLSQVTLAQALPTIIGPLAILRGRRDVLAMLNIGLLMGRFGVLAGMSRAYTTRPWTYWLSPLTDLFIVTRMWTMWARRVHTWRGRTLVAGDHA